MIKLGAYKTIVIDGEQIELPSGLVAIRLMSGEVILLGKIGEKGDDEDLFLANSIARYDFKKLPKAQVANIVKLLRHQGRKLAVAGTAADLMADTLEEHMKGMPDE